MTSNRVGPYALIERLSQLYGADLWRSEHDKGEIHLVWVPTDPEQRASEEGMAAVRRLGALQHRALPKILDAQPGYLALPWKPVKPAAFGQSIAGLSGVQMVRDVCQGLVLAKVLHFGLEDMWLVEGGGVSLIGLAVRRWLGVSPAHLEPHQERRRQNAFHALILLSSFYGNTEVISDMIGFMRLDEAHEYNCLEVLPEALKPFGERLLVAEGEEGPTLDEVAWWLSVYLAEAPDSHPEVASLLLDQALEWLRDKAYEEDLAAVRELLEHRPEFRRVPAITGYIWSHFESVLMAPFERGGAIPASYAQIISHIPEAVEGLGQVLEASEGDIKGQIAAAHLLGEMGASSASPSLTRALNHGSALVSKEARAALALIGQEQVVGLDTQRTRIVPCSQSWDCMSPMASASGEMRFCNKCDTPVVKVRDLASLQALTGKGCALFDPPAVSDTGDLMMRSTTGRLWSLAVGERISIGSQWSQHIVQEGLEPLHASLEHLGEGRVLIRAEDGEVTLGPVVVHEAIFDVEDRLDVSVGPLRLTRSGGERALVVSGHTNNIPMLAGVVLPPEPPSPPIGPGPEMPAGAVVPVRPPTHPSPIGPPPLSGAPVPHIPDHMVPKTPPMVPPKLPEPPAPEEKPPSKSMWTRFKDMF